LLGSTRGKLIPKALAKTLEFARPVRWPFRDTRIDRTTLELISAIPREEMNVKMWRGIAMYFIVHLDRHHDPIDRPRDLANISHQCSALGVCHLMELDHVPAKD